MKLIAISQRIEKSKYNEIRPQLDIRLFDFIIKCGFYPVPIPYFLDPNKKSISNLNKWLKIIKPDGLILSGGEDLGKNRLRDRSEYFLFNYFKKNNLPIIGICRGMQLIASIYGSKLKKVKNHVNKKTKISFGNKFQKVKCYHNYSITKCPSEFEIISKSKDNQIESINSKNNKILGLMWHPERDKIFSKFNISIFKKFLNK